MAINRKQKVKEPGTTGIGRRRMKRGNPEIAPDALLAWGRIPASAQKEILDVLKLTTPNAKAKTRHLRVGKSEFSVRQSSSGFRVVYEVGNDRDKIVSVFTPREAALLSE
ncbi:hypothetical protein ACS0Y7_35240 [Burkholderia gladioli]|uniref:hypothetical protein n=1 Tax=Burkholderia gladioli TaxID=28095 RepID=UPI003F7A05AB